MRSLTVAQAQRMVDSFKLGLTVNRGRASRSMWIMITDDFGDPVVAAQKSVRAAVVELMWRIRHRAPTDSIEWRRASQILVRLGERPGVDARQVEIWTRRRRRAR